MNIERTWWFRVGVPILTLASAFGLFYYAGSWPFGPRSIAGVLVFFFCLLGLQRLYEGLFGVAAIILIRKPPDANEKR
jgi:hypothetical protein